MADRDQSPTHGTGVPGESSDPATAGNRPATGARLVDHPTSLPGGFGGGAEATDFLGLSQELTGPMDTGFAPPTGVPGGRTHPGDYPTDPTSSASWLLQQERIEGTEGPAPESETEGEEQEMEPVQGSKRPISAFAKIAAVLLVLGGGTAGYFAWERMQTSEPSDLVPPTVAHTPTKTPTPATGTNPNGQPTQPDGSWKDPEFRPLTESATTANPDGTTATSAEVPPTGEDTTPRIGESRLAEWVEKNPDGVGSGALMTDLLGLAPGSGSETTPPAGTETATSTGAETLASNPAKDPSTEPSALRKGPHAEATPAKSPVGSLRLATPEELAGIWPGDTVPMEALDGENRLLTPGVGQVHVIMKTGDIFDGRLYAIGAGQVWLESAVGRLALEANRVGTISLVTMEEEDGKKVEDLPRMRVRTPGGIFFGKVVAHEGDRVTLLTEDGGKITLVSRDVEPAPLGDTRVIGRVEKP